MFPLNTVVMFILAYADDLVFLIKNEHNIAKVINLIEKWSRENNMVINYAKSAIVPLGIIKKHSIFKNCIEYLKFPIKREYKYLGVFIDQKLTFQKALSEIEIKCDKLCGRLYIINKCIGIADRLFLFMVFICPQYDLLAPLIPFGCENFIQKVSKSQKKMLK